MSVSSLPDDRVSELAETFHLLGDANRLRIVLSCMATPTCVQDIAARLGLSASLVSHHLRLLRAARLLRAERRGKRVFYSAADDHVRDVLSDMGRARQRAGRGGGLTWIMRRRRPRKPVATTMRGRTRACRTRPAEGLAAP